MEKAVRLKRPEGLNIIPFIDIMLVLLAITLTTTTFIKEQNITLALPKASQAKVSKIGKKYHISLQKNGTLYFENKKLSVKELEKTLEVLPFDVKIALQADRKSEFGIFVEVIDILKKQNKSFVNIVVEKE